MAADKPDNGAAVPPAAVPAIVLTFAGLGLAEVSMRAENVTPAQVYLAAWYLEAVARELRAGQVQERALGGLVGAAGLTPETIAAAIAGLKGH